MRLNVPVDVITIRKALWEKYRDTPGTLAYEASREGVTVAQTSSM